MSRIHNLMAVRTGGVEFKGLGELGEFIRGNGLQKKDLTDEGIGAIHYGQIHTHYGTSAIETKSFVAKALAAKLRKARPGDLVIATTSEDDDAVAKAVAWLGKDEVAVSSDAYIYRHRLEPTYLSYFFQSDQFQSQKRRFISGTKVRRMSGDSLAKIRIAVPPPAIQQEIAGILTRMEELQAELDAELHAELEARRRQYEHYRNSLLTFSREKVPWVPLGELVRINFGARITRAKDAGTLYPVYGGGGESFRTDAYNRADEWVISRFAMSENCVRRVRGRFWMLDSGFTFDVVAPDLNKDYVGQMLLKMQPLIFMTSTQSAQKNIDIDGFKRLTIPVPSPDDQGRIVEVLDRCDELVKDLSIGLRAELAGRQQQYEYYRNLLFTFSEAA